MMRLPSQSTGLLRGLKRIGGSKPIWTRTLTGRHIADAPVLSLRTMKENAYFDNAATTWPKPEAVYAYMDSFFRSHGVNPGRGGHTLAIEAEQMVTQTRRLLAQFFGFSGPSNRVVFTQNGTDSLNMAIGGLLQAGDHMVTTRLEHNAVLRASNHLERDGGISVTRVAPDADGYVSVESIEAAIGAATRAIVLNHASNVIGTVQPLEAVAEVARRRGVALIVDAAQTAGVIPIDMSDLGIAALAFPGHKGLFGPMGIGGLIVSESLDLRPLRFGGTGIDSISTYQPEAYPHRLEAGTISVPGIAGLNAAQHWFARLGAESVLSGDHQRFCVAAQHQIHSLELGHLRQIESMLKRYSAVRIMGKARESARVATLSFVVEGVSSQQIADQLDADHHICTRAGLQCAPLVHVDAHTVEGGGTVRLSPGYFTDEEDMQQLMSALEEILS